MADTDGLTAANNKSNHAVLHRFDIPIEENISGRNIYWSLFKSKNKERKIFDNLYCPFKQPAKQNCQL